MKYASIVPLIGGETLGMQEAADGQKPEFILSYSAFEANDRQLVEHYKNEVPYHHLDTMEETTFPKVDVINTVCPCAGLSSLSPSSATTNASNDWMIDTAKYVLGTMGPKVFWGENAPRLASKMGQPIVEKLREIGKQHGYAFSLYKTKSMLHGLSQVRDRCFYFFWKGDEVPRFEYYDRPHEKIEDTIRNTVLKDDDPMNVPVNKKKPTDNPFYKYVLDEMKGGMSHSDFQDSIEKTTNPLWVIEGAGIKYDEVARWMRKEGYELEAGKCDRMFHKLAAGGNIMRKMTEIPKHHIGAFVGHTPTSLCHPDEDRYLTIRECLNIMKMPGDFVLQGGVKNLNMICQNVPVTTARDMAEHTIKFVDGRLSNQMIQSDFVIQDNKTQTITADLPVSTLDEFAV